MKVGADNNSGNNVMLKDNMIINTIPKETLSTCETPRYELFYLEFRDNNQSKIPKGTFLCQRKKI